MFRNKLKYRIMWERRIIFPIRRLVSNMRKGFNNIVKYFVYKLYSSRMDYRRAAKADDMASFMWDFEMYLRSQWKYADTPDDINTIYEKWFEEKNEHDINLDELIQ